MTSVVPMHHHLLLIVILCSTVLPSSATPFLHTPNAGCAISDSFAICVPMCVRDVRQCPKDQVPTCDEGSVFCPDGQCHTGRSPSSACAWVPDVCACHGSSSVPCKRVEKSIRYDGSDTQLGSGCATALNTSTVGTCLQSSTDITRSRIGNATRAVVWLHYLTGIYFLFVLIFWIYKKRQETRMMFRTSGEARGYVELDDVVDSEYISNAHLTHSGFEEDAKGTFLFRALGVIILLWVGLIIMLVAELYKLGFDKDQIKRLNVLFVWVWHVSLLLLLGLRVFSSSIRNFFRLRAPMSRATTIRIWECDDSPALTEDTRVVKFVRTMQTRLKKIVGGLGSFHNETIRQSDGIRFFQYRCRRFVYDSTRDSWQPVKIPLPNTYSILAQLARNGLSDDEANSRLNLQGPNEVEFEVPTIPVAIFREFFTPMYIYQLQCLWVWFYVHYWVMAIIHGFVIISAGVAKAVMSVWAQRRVRDMARHHQDVNTFRHGSWSMLEAAQLVPGDVVELKDDLTMPFDAVLCEGTAVVDQSSLTGESVPQPKWPLDASAETEYEKRGRGSKHTLLAGTIVVQQTNPTGERGGAIVLVVDTGANTSKGEMIRDLLYPEPVTFTFDVELRAVYAILLVWSLFGFWASIWMIGGDTVSAWFYGIFTLGLIIEPVLPAYLVVGQSVAARRLSKKGIYCRDLSRIIASAKIRIFALDKTGTITRQGVRFAGVQPIANSAFDEVKEHPDELPTLAQLAMASAHTLVPIGAHDLIGHAVDREMFAATNFSISLSSENSSEHVVLRSETHVLDVIRTLEFESALMRMVAVVRERNSGEVFVFCKGSYESIRTLVDEASLPPSYNEVAIEHARQGCYTLALAFGELGSISDASVRAMSRAQIESNLTQPLALVLFQNVVRPDSAAAISALKSADVRPVMLTGDNVFTGVYAARESGMISPDNSEVIYGDVLERATSAGAAGPRGRTRLAEEHEEKREEHARPQEVRFTTTTIDGEEQLVDVSKRILELQAAAAAAGIERQHRHPPPPPRQQLGPELSCSGSRGLEIAITRRAFRSLCSSGRILELLPHIRVFARLHPDDKVSIVRLLQRDSVVAMCGDGGNDCGALQAAHAGVALSDGDASIAAPFSATTKSLQSCVDLIIMGRAALATDVALFKNIVAFGEIMFFAKLSAYYFTVVLSQFIWAIVEGPILLGLSWAMSLAEPAQTLKPRRPTARLLGPESVISTVGIIFINAVFVLLGIFLLYHQDFMRCNEFNAEFIDTFEWWRLQDNYEGEVIGLISLWQCLVAPALFNLGGEHRARWRKNRVLVGLFTGLLGLSTFAILADPNSLSCLMRVNCGNERALHQLGYQVPWFVFSRFESPIGHNVMPMNFRWKLLLFVCINALVNWVFQELVINQTLRSHLRKRYGKKKRLEYLL